MVLGKMGSAKMKRRRGRMVKPFRGLEDVLQDWVNTYCNVAGQACQRASLQPLHVGAQNNHPQHSNELIMSKGMRYANQALLSGCSAGGLAAILHCDEFRNLFPQNTEVKCLSDAGLLMNAY
ncbi:unnamed protein product [Cuscuta campestris]|uniref:Pectin acetylesterase n=1 Tax=Cuscuta campestris TaxID=132261 RepID=A0A484KCJ2_9ASTE|nr:unnamed protein product [Cuscuta campestris]